MQKTTDSQLLEVLESRIAPASLVSFTDTDGDTVTVKLTGAGDASHNAGEITLTGTDALTSLLSISVKKAVGGDGFADIEKIAGTGLKALLADKVNLTGAGIDLTGLLSKVSVHDLEGSADIKAGGTKADKSVVTVGHIGAGSTIELGSVFSSLTALDTDGDKYTISLKGDGGFQGSLADGISLWNTTTKSTLGITVAKDKISGDGLVDLKAITQGTGVTGLGTISAPLAKLTDNLTLSTSVGKITLGDIDTASVSLGGTATDKATFTAGKITGSDLAFGGKLAAFTSTHFESGTLTAAVITTLKITGNTKAGLEGDLGATVEAGSIATASVKDDLTGSINADTTLGKVSIGDDVLGGSTRGSGAILAGQSIGSVAIVGDLKGGTGELTGVIFQYSGDFADDVHTLINPGASASVKTSAITIGGTVFGGSGDFSGGILVHNVKTLSIKGNLEGGDNTTNGDLTNTGFVYGTLINTLNIGGSIIAGDNTGGGTLENSGAVNVRSYIAAVNVGVNITGSATNPDASLTSFGLVQSTPGGPGIFDFKGNHLGFGKITVKGNVSNTGIIAGADAIGFDNIATQTNNATDTGVREWDTAHVNAFVGIGSVSIGGNLVESAIVAGVSPGGDGSITTATDYVPGTAINPGGLYSGSPANIASLVVKGAAGAAGSILHTEQYGKITVTGAAFPTFGFLKGSPDPTHLNIVFNYDYDTTGFFNDPARRALLDAAAANFEARLIASDFGAIVAPGGANSWTLEFLNPSLPMLNVELDNPNLAGGTIVIYVGAQVSPGTQVAQATIPSYGFSFLSNATGTAWKTLFQERDSTTDYRSMGGSIWFDTATNWYFDNDASTMEMFTGMDFYTVAMHEIGHILGFSDGPKAYASHIVTVGADKFFNGPNTVALFGDKVPMKPVDPDHFKEGILFNNQRLAMDPIHATGDRDTFTELDWAVLKDLGYTVLPA